MGCVIGREAPSKPTVQPDHYAFPVSSTKCHALPVKSAVQPDRHQFPVCQTDRKKFPVRRFDRASRKVLPLTIEITENAIVMPTVCIPLESIRRFGYQKDHVLFETGRRCPSGEGVHTLYTNEALDIFHVLVRLLESPSSTLDANHKPKGSCKGKENSELSRKFPKRQVSSKSLPMLEQSRYLGDRNTNNAYILDPTHTLQSSSCNKTLPSRKEEEDISLNLVWRENA